MKGQKTTGYSSPLLTWTVTILTIFSSVSRRIWYSSAASPSLTRSPNQVRSPSIPSPVRGPRGGYFKTVEHVGQPALAVRTPQQPPPHPFPGHQGLGHDHKTPLQPGLVVIAELLQTLLPGLLILEETGDIVT